MSSVQIYKEAIQQDEKTEVSNKHIVNQEDTLQFLEQRAALSNDQTSPSRRSYEISMFQVENPELVSIIKEETVARLEMLKNISIATAFVSQEMKKHAKSVQEGKPYKSLPLKDRLNFARNCQNIGLNAADLDPETFATRELVNSGTEQMLRPKKFSKGMIDNAKKQMARDLEYLQKDGRYDNSSQEINGDGEIGTDIHNFEFFEESSEDEKSQGSQASQQSRRQPVGHGGGCSDCVVM